VLEPGRVPSTSAFFDAIEAAKRSQPQVIGDERRALEPVARLADEPVSSMTGAAS
jgi:hypothetical protein